MEFITYLISLIFGLKQVQIEQIATSTPIEIIEISTSTPEIKPVKKQTKKTTITIVENEATSTVNIVNVVEEVATSTKTDTQVSNIVSQPIVQYNSVQEQIISKKMEVTITEPEVSLNQTPNSSKYIITFDISDTSKEVEFRYEEISPVPKYTKGGMLYRANQPYVLNWERAGEFSYTISYNNGEVIKEGTFTVTE